MGGDGDDDRNSFSEHASPRGESKRSGGESVEKYMLLPLFIERDWTVQLQQNWVGFCFRERKSHLGFFFFY